MANERITLQDDVKSAMYKVSEGNPGALHVLVEAFQKSPVIDPESVLRGFGPLFSCDAEGLYGSNIWILYKDVCGQDIVKFLAVLRGRQLGLVAEHPLSVADPDAVLAAVKEKLPTFDAAATETA